MGSTTCKRVAEASSRWSRGAETLRRMYERQLEDSDDSSEGTARKVLILNSWVEDLTEQNATLMNAVMELEAAAVKQLELRADLCNLLELFRRLREEGFWYVDNLKFKTVTYEDIFGSSAPRLTTAWCPRRGRTACDRLCKPRH